MKLSCLSLVIALSLLISCQGNKQHKTGTSSRNNKTPVEHSASAADTADEFFHIRITSDEKELNTMYLYRIKTGGNKKEIQTATGKNGVFYFGFKNKLPADLYSLEWNDGQLPVLVDNTDVEIGIRNGEVIKIDGQSAMQKTYNKFILNSIKSDNRFAKEKKFIEEHPKSVLSAWVLKNMLGPTRWRMQQTQKLYEILSDKVKKTPAGIAIAGYLQKGLGDLTDEEIERNEQKDPPPVPENTGEKTPKPVTKPKPAAKTYVPYFYAYDLNGSEVSAKNIFNRHRLIYIDFWASWCVPCRHQNPELVKLYAKYKDKGLEIISVSQDKDKNDCQNAVDTDGLNWVHVWDSDGQVSALYNVHSIPDGFLVDSEGGLIAKNIGAGRLGEILQRRLK